MRVYRSRLIAKKAITKKSERALKRGESKKKGTRTLHKEKEAAAKNWIKGGKGKEADSLREVRSSRPEDALKGEGKGSRGGQHAQKEKPPGKVPPQGKGEKNPPELGTLKIVP